MLLGDMSNSVLVLLQQPGAAFVVYEGNVAPAVTGPSWSSLTNPQFSQGLVEFAINEGYKVLMGDIEDIELALVSYTTPSIASTYKYPLPGTTSAATTNYATVSHVAKVFYQPYGLPYNWEFRPGSGLISWSEYQRSYTGQGYLQPYAFGTQPLVATVDPPRQNLYFFPGSARASDTITVEYAPIPTPPSSAGVAATGCSILINPTDSPIIPADCHMAIVYYALGFLWVRAREQATALMYYNPAGAGLYQSELKKIRQKYTKVAHGDVIRMESTMMPLSLGGLGGGRWGPM
jgi:hypothetical protein